MTTKKTPSDVFHYIRGALRGNYGVEDFRGKSVLVIGVNRFGQDIVGKLCFDKEVKLFFVGSPGQELMNYFYAFNICRAATPWQGESIDITIDTESKRVVIDGTAVRFEMIGEEPYKQGIHDFYC
jgi:hypothetical protein